MLRYEYKVVPAPEQGRRAKGVKGTAGRFAHALETLMNDLGAEGWEYLRCDTLPCEERTGLTGRTTRFQNMLVFRRALAESRTEPSPHAALRLPAPVRTPQEGATEPPPPRPAHEPEAAKAAAAAAAALSAYRGDSGDSDDPRLAAE